MTPERNEVVGILKTEMILRQQRNPSYSLRAFARDLATSPAALSLVLQGKRAVTTEKAIAWADSLKLTTDKRQTLLSAVTRDLEVRLDPIARKTRSLEERMVYMRLKHDEFAPISDWWHFGLMNLVKLKNFENDIKWMSSKLGITSEQCTEALERLARLKLMEQVAGQWVRTSRSIETSSDLPSEAIKSFHRQNIRRALKTIDEVEVQDRDISSIIVATNKEKLAEAKKRIRLFRKELAEYLSSDDGDEVYSLNIQLFPQTVKATGEKE